MGMIKRTAVTIALIFAPAAFAQTYIVPVGCGTVTFQVSRGTEFPKLAETVAADNVTDVYVYLPKQRLVPKLADGPQSLTFDSKVPDDGVVMAAVDLKPAVRGNETRTEHAKAF